MRIEARNCTFEATPDNTVMYIGETLLNCIYTDLGDDYVTIPAELTRNYVQTAIGLHKEGVPVERVHTGEYDPTEVPFVHIINGLCRAFRYEVDRLVV